MKRLLLPLALVGALFEACPTPPAPCGPTTCDGCCSNGECVTPSAVQCGRGGSQCTTCGLGNACVVGVCTPTGPGGGGEAGGGSAGGASAGGATAGGDAGGSTAGGSAAGGSTAGGSTAGGSTAGGSTAGGSTAGGSTAGGSTAGGSTAGGSTAGGSTAGGSTAGGSGGGTVLPDGGIPQCAGTLIQCGTSCVDRTSDVNNCGRCGNACGPGQVCGNGTCQALPTDCVASGGCNAPGYSCDPVTHMCSTGGCRVTAECPMGATCNTTSRTCSCPSGQHACGQSCVPNSEVTSCGSTSCAVCPSTSSTLPVCTMQGGGSYACGQTCNLATCTPPANSAATCNGTTCDFTCNSGFLKCGTGCGACTTPANASPVCNGAACDFACNAGFHRCGSQCLPNGDVNSCGTRCTACPAAPGSTATCFSPPSGQNTCGCASGSSFCGTTCVAPALATCSGHGTCADTGGAPTCACSTGYTGTTCSSCAAGYQDNDGNGTCLPTCATFSPTACNGHGTCADTSGIATCTCQTGYAGAQCERSAFVKVVTGYFHSCGLRSNGAVECWGSTTAGATAVPTGLSATDLAAGDYFTCAIRSTGLPVCWGYASGFISNPGGSPMATAPNLPTTGSYSAIYAGDMMACAVSLSATTANATCFGYNLPPGAAISDAFWIGIGEAATAQAQYAKISYATGALTTFSVPGTPPATPTLGYAQVSCGVNYCCAIEESRSTTGQRLQGALRCWGTSTLSTVTGAPVSTARFAAVSAGNSEACAIRSTPTTAATDLQLTCWGLQPTVFSSAPSGQFVDVAVAYTHACAVATTGEIRCWGSNGSGEAPSFRN